MTGVAAIVSRLHAQRTAWLRGCLMIPALLMFPGTAMCETTAAPQAKVVKIGAEDDWYPYSARRDGKPVGMVPEIVRAAFAAEGVKVELVSLPYSRCMKLAASSLLLGCFDTLRNPTLENKYLWARHPLLRARIDIYARADAPDTPAHLDDLHGKLIGVTNGYEYGAPFDSDTTMQRDIADSDLFALRKLAAGRVDYALVYTRIVSTALRDHPDLQGKIKPVGTLIEPDIYISFGPEYVDVRHYIDLFDAGMARILKDGQYAKIEARWR